MWKKLTDLLFEEDDDEVIDDETVEEVKVTKIAKPIENIEIKPVVEKQPVVKPVIEEVKPVAEEKPKPLGIVVDELQEVRPVANKQLASNESYKPKEEKPKAINRPRVVPTSKPDTKFNYEFTPVISPIFGISEKDIDAVIPTNINKKKTGSDSKIGTVISPIYGIERDIEADNTYGKIEQKTSTVEEKEAEEEIFNFSLDDILAKRDSEYDLNKTKFFKTSDLDEVDRTTVLNNHNMSLFDEDDE